MPIEVKNLFYSYGKKTENETLALDDVSLTIPDHSFTAFVGETGSGKTTLIQNLNGLLTPMSGTVQADEFIITPNKKKNRNGKELRRHVGMVFQFPEYQLFEETVLKDVMFGPKNFGMKEKEAREISEKCLLSVGIDSSYFERSPFELSGGEKRRVAIAGILAIQPDILVLDEPTAGLDPKGSEEIMNLVAKMHEDGKSILLVTHDMNLVMKYCEKVFVLGHGKLLFEGTPAELFASPECRNMSIEVPELYRVAGELKEKGMDIDLSGIRTTEDLVREIRKGIS